MYSKPLQTFSPIEITQILTVDMFIFMKSNLVFENNKIVENLVLLILFVSNSKEIDSEVDPNGCFVIPFFYENSLSLGWSNFLFESTPVKMLVE